MATSETIAKVMAEISLVGYPNFDLSPARTIIWISYLRDIDDALLVNAVRHFIATSKHAFAPSIPEIRHAAAELQRAAGGVPSAFEAWEDLRAAGNGECSRVIEEGGTFIVEKWKYKFLHPLVETVARRMGWPVDYPSHDDIEIDRAHFFRAYEDATARLMTEAKELPQVTEYVQAQRQISAGVKQLTDRLERHHD